MCSNVVFAKLIQFQTKYDRRCCSCCLIGKYVSMWIYLPYRYIWKTSSWEGCRLTKCCSIKSRPIFHQVRNKRMQMKKTALTSPKEFQKLLITNILECKPNLVNQIMSNPVPDTRVKPFFSRAPAMALAFSMTCAMYSLNMGVAACVEDRRTPRVKPRNWRRSEGRQGSHLSEGHGHPTNGVVVRSALERREDGEVDLILQVVHDLATLLVHGADAFTEEDQSGSAPSGQYWCKRTH